ncbi:MAG: SDR family oxidoreductase [Cytophagaceae bacterium]|nr:SDR family oxidoreductase [Cytophagaceae bacterium]MDW8456118.1 SDR family oxidoreductase [Cytophagaceae bacterium]
MKNKTIIITGGSSGIGKACAEIFGAHGANIVISGRNESTLIETTRYLKQKNISAHYVVSDISIESDAQKLINETINTFKKIDVLINNAGISMRAMFEEVDLSVIKKVMDINFYGTVYATKYALPHILQTQGSIVGISSIAGKKGLPARTGYCASKFAMHGFLESLRIELLKKNVHVLLACPGFTASNIRNHALAKDGTPQGESPLDEGKIMPAEEVARHIYKAVKKRKREIVLTNQGKLTVCLNKFFPAFMDLMVYRHFAKEKDSPVRP